MEIRVVGTHHFSAKKTRAHWNKQCTSTKSGGRQTRPTRRHALPRQLKVDKEWDCLLYFHSPLRHPVDPRTCVEAVVVTHECCCTRHLADSSPNPTNTRATPLCLDTLYSIWGSALSLPFIDDRSERVKPKPQTFWGLEVGYLWWNLLISIENHEKTWWCFYFLHICLFDIKLETLLKDLPRIKQHTPASHLNIHHKENILK